MLDPESDEETDQKMLIQVIANDESPRGTIIEAINRNDHTAVINLVKNGTSVNATDNNGCTALHAAVQNENLQILEFLLEQPQVHIDAQMKFGETPLLLSTKASSSAFALKLLAHGADVNIPNKEMKTPLHLSVQTFHDVSLDLIKRGADINVPDCNMYTPLHEAVKNSDFEMTSMLLYYGADADVVARNGLSPFVISLLYATGDVRIQELLMEFEVDYNRITRDNLSTLFIAFLCKSPLCSELIERCADVNYIHPDYNALKFAYYSDETFTKVWDKFNVKKAHTFSKKSPLQILLRSLVSLESPMESDLWVKRLESVLFSEKGIEILLSLTHREIAVSFDDFLSGVCWAPIPRQKLYKLLCIWLSCGLDAIHIMEVRAMYLIYGFSDVLELLINMDVIWHNRFYCLSLPYLICDVRCDKSVADIFLTFCMQIFSLTEYYQLLSLGTPSNVARQLFHDNKNHFVLTNVHRLWLEKIEERLKKLPIVPSLKELSRNSAKKAIIERYDIKKCSLFYSILQRMLIPNIVKHILSFKVPVNIFPDE